MHMVDNVFPLTIVLQPGKRRTSVITNSMRLRQGASNSLISSAGQCHFKPPKLAWLLC